MDSRAWWATVHGVAKSRTRLSDYTFTFKESDMAEQLNDNNNNILDKGPLE